jgi:hypothetical protein
MADSERLLSKDSVQGGEVPAKPKPRTALRGSLVEITPRIYDVEGYDACILLMSEGYSLDLEGIKNGRENWAIKVKDKYMNGEGELQNSSHMFPSKEEALKVVTKDQMIPLRKLSNDTWFVIRGYEDKKYLSTSEYDLDTEGGKHDRRICLGEDGKRHAFDMDSCMCIVSDDGAVASST